MAQEHYVDPTRAAFELFKALPRDEPIFMLNLVRFRARAAYPDGHADAALARSGAEAYREYGRTSAPIFARLGGTIIWRGAMQALVIGPADERWDAVFIARYPSATAFMAMVTDEDYKRAVVHRQAAVETSRLIRCAQLDASNGFA
ncbi:MAG TPA: DUF1330 domain-containing protein [Caulobacterales bacterium]|nr:DUF1330 domain-containing protein [Caulobacterales bacterium]